MKKTMYDAVPCEYRESLKPLAEVLKASISFQWVDNGLIAQQPNFFLSASEGGFLVSMSKIKAVYFVSGKTLNDGLSKRIFQFLSDISENGGGTYLVGKSGIWWAITDIKGYKKFCERHGFAASEFRLYPKVDVVWIPNHSQPKLGHSGSI